MTKRDATLAERLRRLCMSFPQANERLSHGEPTWFAGRGKVFAMLDNHHHGSLHLGVWLPMPPGAQEDLIELDTEIFFRPPYVGPKGWVGVNLYVLTDLQRLRSLVQHAYMHVASKTLQRTLLNSAKN
jgi:predicted DNA-binding protein (MmcQ/YjbR family)